jgi:hypothetical protein
VDVCVGILAAAALRVLGVVRVVEGGAVARFKDPGLMAQIGAHDVGVEVHQHRNTGPPVFIDGMAFMRGFDA